MCDEEGMDRVAGIEDVFDQPGRPDQKNQAPVKQHRDDRFFAVLQESGQGGDHCGPGDPVTAVYLDDMAAPRKRAERNHHLFPVIGWPDHFPRADCIWPGASKAGREFPKSGKARAHVIAACPGVHRDGGDREIKKGRK